MIATAIDNRRGCVLGRGAGFVDERERSDSFGKKTPILLGCRVSDPLN
ncbi:MAG: hypothetical protein N838_29470 [Thiohalocapsa sp. PB-PSB1]|jgi:hypothetical protein|nr:MAG: hypothetical protein N838_29470 [Thiohalocapsa sp. PB-PSB1]